MAVRTCFILFLMLILSDMYGQSGTPVLPDTNLRFLVYKGLYQGRNLYFQNPSHPSNPNGRNPVGAQMYWINGDQLCNFQKKSRTCKWSSVFEVVFDNTLLKIGDSVTVHVAHYPQSTPRCINPEVLLSMSTYKVMDIKLSREGVLKWTTKGEVGKLPFDIMQFRWNKWIKIGEVPGAGIPTENSYTFDVSKDLHSGSNRFRVSQSGYTRKPRFSKPVDIDPGIAEVSLDPLARKFRTLRLSGQTRYEVLDSRDNIVIKGYGDNVDLGKLKKGEYYLHYDNKQEQFLKK